MIPLFSGTARDSFGRARCRALQARYVARYARFDPAPPPEALDGTALAGRGGALEHWRLECQCDRGRRGARRRAVRELPKRSAGAAGRLAGARTEVEVAHFAVAAQGVTAVRQVARRIGAWEPETLHGPR